MNEELELCFIPPLILLVVSAHNKKGSQLTQEEVESIRDSGTCIALPAGSGRSMADERGYEDFNPERVWDDYLDYLNETSEKDEM